MISFSFTRKQDLSTYYHHQTKQVWFNDENCYGLWFQCESDGYAHNYVVLLVSILSFFKGSSTNNTTFCLLATPNNQRGLINNVF